MTTLAPGMTRRLRRRPPSSHRVLFYITPALKPGSETVMSNNILADKAILAALNVTGWSASAQDKDAAAEVAENHQADPDVGRYTKRLLPKEALQEVNALDRELRASHEDSPFPEPNASTACFRWPPTKSTRKSSTNSPKRGYRPAAASSPTCPTTSPRPSRNCPTTSPRPSRNWATSSSRASIPPRNSSRS